MESVTQKVIELIREKTGVPVLVKADPSLRTWAAVMMARRGAAAHIVTFNPKAGGDTDYAICSQCSSILRFFMVPETDRFEFGATPRGRQEVQQLLDEHLRSSGQSLPKEALAQMGNGLFLGLMLQLRSVPIGLRSDAWLAREYPELASQQKAFASRQLGDNLELLGPDVRWANLTCPHFLGQPA
jgi:hypothetical protein